jgi:hypothetical protein
MDKPLLPGRISALLAGICLAASVGLSQSADRYVGTIVSVKTTPAEIEVRRDSESNQVVRVIPETVFQQSIPAPKISRMRDPRLSAMYRSAIESWWLYSPAHRIFCVW